MHERPSSDSRVDILKVGPANATQRSDRVATEEPLEIRLVAGGDTQTVAITMRTPGNDFELAAGFLFTEGVLSEADEIASIRYCTDADVEQRYNVVTVDLESQSLPELHALDRHFTTSSACGVCGKASIDAIGRAVERNPHGELSLDRAFIASLPLKIQEGQGLFKRTGGLHAAALFDERGDIVTLREDVGRHNAVDKAIGWALMQRRTPLNDTVLMVSGRTSFEIVQKAAVAGIPVVCSVSAPSSLAIDTAQRFGMTLIGFVRDETFNVYAGADRVDLATVEPRSLLVESGPRIAGGRLARVEDREPNGDRAEAAEHPR